MHLGSYATVVIAVFGFSALTLAHRWNPELVRGRSSQRWDELPPLVAIEGRVETLDGRGSELRLRLDGGQINHFRVDASTSVFVHGRLGDLSDLSSGQRVSATYETGSETPSLAWLELLDP